jgi:hypothetical protein
MAVFAGSAFGAGMRILLEMAAHTGHRRAFVYAIDVAQGALDSGVRAT